MVGLTTLSGLLLSHIHISTTIFTAITPYSSLITPTLLILSLVLMSYPFDNATSAPWSSYLTALGLKYLPRSSELVRMWASIGSILLVFSLSLSPLLRRLLSQKPLLFLGRISFPIYLLHGTMLRTIFAWVLFAGQKEVNGRYPQGPWVVKCLAVMVFLAATGGISWFWMENVEPVFARVTAAVERNVMGVGGSRPGSPRSPKRGILGEFGDRKE